MNATPAGGIPRFTVPAAPAKHQTIDDFLADIYEVCLRHPEVSAYKKQRVLERAADLGRESWKVVGISEAALRQFVRQGDLRGIQRGHKSRYWRRDRAREALSAPMSKEAFLRHFREGDDTVLVTVAEQYREPARIIPIDDPTLFQGDETVRVTPENHDWAARTLATLPP